MNDLILNFTPENMSAFQDRVTTMYKGSSAPTKMSKRNASQVQKNVENSDIVNILVASILLAHTMLEL